MLINKKILSLLLFLNTSSFVGIQANLQLEENLVGYCPKLTSENSDLPIEAVQFVDLDLAIKNELSDYQKLNKLSSATVTFGTPLDCFVIRAQDRNEYPYIYNMTEKIAQQLGIKTPEILITKSKLFNAAAVPSSSASLGDKMVIGISLLNDSDYSMTYNELAAIVAHELAHIKCQHISKRMSLLKKSLGVYVASAVAVKLFEYQAHELYKKFNYDNKQYKLFGKELFSKHDLTTKLVGHGVNIASVLSILLYFLKQARNQEQEADLTAIDITKDNLSLISALDKLQKVLMRDHPTMPKAPGWFSTHPVPADREKYLREIIV